MKKKFIIFTTLLLLIFPYWIHNQFKIKKVEQKKLFAKPSITILYPNGGEKWEKGKGYTIRWKSKGISGNVKIKLKWGTSSGGWFSVTNSTLNTGTYLYNIPRTGIGQTGNQFKIYVMNNVESVKDESDGFFRILIPRYLKLLFPNGGEKLEQWREHIIRWTSKGKISSVELMIEKKGGHLSNITYPLTGNITVPNTGSYLWRINRSYHPGKYKILIRTINKKVNDKSNKNFDIILPKINLVCGIGKFGESWKTKYYVIAAKKTKYMNFEIFVTNRGTQFINHVPVMWSILKQPGNLVIVQEEAAFDNVYPNRTYKTVLKFEYKKSKAYPFYWEKKKIWKKGDYSFEFEIDPMNTLGQYELSRSVKKCRVDFKVN